MRYTLRLYSALYPDRVLGEPEARTRRQIVDKVRFYLLSLADQYDKVAVVNTRTGRVLDTYVRHHGVIASMKSLDRAIGQRAYLAHRYIVTRNRTVTSGASIEPKGAVICRVHCDDPLVLQTWLFMEWPEGDAAAVSYSHARPELRAKADRTALVTFPTDPTERAVVKRPLKIEKALVAKFPNAKMLDHRRREEGDGMDESQVVLAKVGRRFVTCLYVPDDNPVFLPRFAPTARLARADFNQRLA